MNFIDFICEPDGEYWYNADDILQALGYKVYRTSLLNKKSTARVIPYRLINNVRWWNENGIAQFKALLSKSHRSKTYYNNWGRMMRLLSDSKYKDTLAMKDNVAHPAPPQPPEPPIHLHGTVAKVWKMGECGAITSGKSVHITSWSELEDLLLKAKAAGKSIIL